MADHTIRFYVAQISTVQCIHLRLGRLEDAENFPSRELTSIRISDVELRDLTREITPPDRTDVSGRYNVASIDKVGITGDSNRKSFIVEDKFVNYERC